MIRIPYPGYANAVYAARWLTNYNHGPGYNRASTTAANHRGLAGARNATGIVLCCLPGSIADAAYLTAYDARGSGELVRFEFDHDDPPAFDPLRTPVSLFGLTTAEEVAAALDAAIQASGLELRTEVVGSTILWRATSRGYVPPYTVTGVTEIVLTHRQGFDGCGAVPIRWGLSRGAGIDPYHSFIPS